MKNRWKPQWIFLLVAPKSARKGERGKENGKLGEREKVSPKDRLVELKEQ